MHVSKLVTNMLDEFRRIATGPDNGLHPLLTKFTPRNLNVVIGRRHNIQLIDYLIEPYIADTLLSADPLQLQRH